MCGRKAKTSGGNQKSETQETDSKATTTASSEVDCSVYNFNATGCNIELAGELLIIMENNSSKNGVNLLWRNGLYCFCKQLYSYLNGTNITAEILTGSNKYKNCSSIANSHESVNETFLQKELKSLNSKYQPIDGEAGMALILSDTPDMFNSLGDLPDEEQEPFIYFVSVGKGTKTSPNNSCHRQYRAVNDTSDISNIGLELERHACNPLGYMKNNSCLRSTSHTPAIPTTASQVKMPVVVVSVIGALMLAVVIVLCLIFAPKCRRKGKSRKDTFVEFSAVDSGFGGLTVYSEAKPFPQSSSRDSQNIYNALWEKEKIKKNKENDENYHDLDMNFVEGNDDTSLYDHMKKEEDLDDVFEAPS
ncbi:uncharacterized protein LOC133195860 [Saccostrea echinata]|uniref:uncharacterized protein LOC133195860 n=1 Tax=Saccostrea echinata TaxID=191078 RepID=UPI002A83DC52|nr:uncharacterized protein LOC133195860 [Saccostrea echinata]